MLEKFSEEKKNNKRSNRRILFAFHVSNELIR